MDDDGGLELKNKRTKRRGLRRTRKREDRDTGEVQRSAPDLFTQDEVQSPLIIRTDADEEGDDEAERPKTPEESGFITAPGQPAPSELAQEDEHDTMRRKALRKKKQPRKQRDRIETQSSDKSLDEGAPLLSPDPKTTEDNQTMTTSQLRMMKRDRALHMRRRQKRADSPIPEEEKSDSDKESKIDGEEEKDDKEEKPESRRRRCPTLADVQSCWMQFNDRMYRTCRLPRCCVRFFQRPLPMMGLGPMPRTAEEEGHVKAAINLERCSRDDDVLSIVVAAAEALTEDPRVVHPLVRIHFVDLRTGTYLARAKHQPDASFAWEKKTPIQKGRKKLQSNSDSEDEDEEKEDSEQEVEEDPRYVTILGGPATTQYEEATVFPLGGPRGQAQRKVDQKVEYLLPIQTRPFALRGSNTAPTWEEEIITNEGFRWFR